MTDEEKKLNEAIKQDGIETQSEILEELKRRYPQYVEQSGNEHEIERMAKVLYGHYCGNDKCGKCKQPNCIDYIRATHLANAGIGDKKQAVKEAFDLAKCYLHSNPNLDSELVKVSIDRELDELFTELYGAEE